MTYTVMWDGVPKTVHTSSYLVHSLTPKTSYNFTVTSDFEMCSIFKGTELAITHPADG